MSDLRTVNLATYLAVASQAATAAAHAIRPEFGRRTISAFKGSHDVQLRADLVAQQIVVDTLTKSFPECGIVAEEDYGTWSDERFLWAVDPLDGTNNFGYGIAHFAIAITLFQDDRVALALIYDPYGGRVFSVREGHRPEGWEPYTRVPLARSTLSLVTGYADPGPEWGARFTEWMGPRCKRVVNLWAPALDLALVSTGALDAMVCRDATLLDVCGGLFLVKAAGGVIFGLDGAPLEVRRSMHDTPVSFVAARSQHLAQELVSAVTTFDSGG